MSLDAAERRIGRNLTENDRVISDIAIIAWGSFNHPKRHATSGCLLVEKGERGDFLLRLRTCNLASKSDEQSESD